MTDTDRDVLAALERVDSRATFVAFVRVLRAELEESNRRETESPSSPNGPQALGWENARLPAFLAAMEAWGTDTSGDRPDEKASWRALAEFLCAAKIYE
jgi:hypothetical protein